MVPREGSRRQQAYSFRRQGNDVRWPVVDWKSKLFSVFVGKLHPKTTLAYLWKVFTKVGVVVDAYIPPIQFKRKNTRFGIYGFVRFRHKFEAEEAIKWGSKLLGGDQATVSFANSVRGGLKRDFGIKVGTAFCCKVGVGFLSKDAVIKGVKAADERSDKEGANAQYSIHSSISTEIVFPHGDMDWLEKSAVGTLKNVMDSTAIQEQLNEQGTLVQISPISSLTNLITFQSKEAMKVSLDNEGDWSSSWYLSVKPWQEGIIEKLHRVWVKMEDVPLGLWHENFFRKVGSDWGRVLCLAEVTQKRLLLTAAWILVDVSSLDKIPDKLHGSFNGIKMTSDASAL